MKHKVINKGYTITVKSWENDGDYSNTKSIVVDSLDKAKAYWDMMQLCKSSHKGATNLGNTCDEFSAKQIRVIVDFMRSNPILFEGDDPNSGEEHLVDWFTEIAGELLGYSEFYACRVMEECIITYSPEDIYVEQIEFK